jgi:hypothetical protein
MICPRKLENDMRRALKNGRINIAQAMFNFIPCAYLISSALLLTACQFHCGIEFFDWAMQQKGRFQWDLQLLGYSAIFHDRYDVVFWIQRNFPSQENWNCESLYFAAEVRNLAMLDWLISYVPQLSTNQLKLCTRNGARPEPILQWFSINYYPNSETLNWYRRKRFHQKSEDNPEVGASVDSVDFPNIPAVIAASAAVDSVDIPNTPAVIAASAAVDSVDFTNIPAVIAASAAVDSVDIPNTPAVFSPLFSPLFFSRTDFI